MQTVTLEDYMQQAKERFGEDRKEWQFICPKCKTVQSFQDFIKADVSKDQAEAYLGYSCVGRFTKEKGCDWTLGGLFRIHTLEIETEDGKKHPRFELAPNPHPEQEMKNAALKVIKQLKEEEPIEVKND